MFKFTECPENTGQYFPKFLSIKVWEDESAPKSSNSRK